MIAQEKPGDRLASLHNQVSEVVTAMKKHHDAGDRTSEQYRSLRRLYIDLQAEISRLETP